MRYNFLLGTVPMSLWSRKRGVKLSKQVHAPATSPLRSDNSSATPTPTEEVQKSRKREFWNGVTSFLKPTPQNDTTTSMHTASTPPEPSHEEGDPEGNDTIVKAPQNPIRSPLIIGELLQQKASDLWSKAYNELSVEYRPDLGGVDNTDNDKPEKLEALKQLLEHAMEAKRENIASQWR